MKHLIVIFLPLLLTSCQAIRMDSSMSNTAIDEKQILAVIDDIEAAANRADPSLAERHLLLDDERFTEIEDFIPEPFGADGVRQIHEWIRENGKPGDNVRFTQRRVYLLSAATAYATSIQELSFDKPSKSRVTLLFLKVDGRWRVIHGHYSTMPEGG
ncbi:MAG: hypothetical protein GY835_01055 [bacterium]|nr:hypothetical protein [bacterium]